MTECWHILRSGPGMAAWNMGLDEALLESSGKLSRPILRFYGWTEAAATFGYSQRYEEVACWTGLRPLIRRTTGGGLVPHDADWTYSLIFPPSHPWYHLHSRESYQRLHQWIHVAFFLCGTATELSASDRKAVPGQCFVGAELFDLLQHNRKIAGAAQRRSRHGFMIQGSIQPGASAIARTDWETAMLEAGTKQHRTAWEAWMPSDMVLRRAGELAQDKYSQPCHNQRR